MRLALRAISLRSIVQNRSQRFCELPGKFHPPINLGCKKIPPKLWRGRNFFAAKLSGLELSGEKVSAIKCYLTGERLESGEFSIRKLEIKDKHGLSRAAYNAKVNIYRELAQPILLGIEDKKLVGTSLSA